MSLIALLRLRSCNEAYHKSLPASSAVAASDDLLSVARYERLADTAESSKPDRE
jgi:hypothetical protein